MATSTEKNPDTQSADGIADEVKVIAIKLPFDLQERLLCFPFLHAIRNLYPKAELHFITPKKEIEVLNLLPFQAFYHEFNENDIKTILDVHPYTASSKIFNVDLFISLTNSLADAALGLGLRAKKRLGFSDGWKTLVLNEKITRPVGHHTCEDFFALYELHSQQKIDEKHKIMSRRLEPAIPEWQTEPYIAINLSPLREATIEDEWIELISLFDQQHIVLFSEDPFRISTVIERFVARLPANNTYTYFYHKNWIELAKMLAFSQGCISFNGPVASLAAYVGANTLALYDSEDPQKTGPFYFLANVQIMNVNDPTMGNASKTTGSMKTRKTFNMLQVFTQAFTFFRLSSTERL